MSEEPDPESPTPEEPPAEPPAVPPSPVARFAALALYLPPIAALAWLVAICGMILAHGDMVGLRGIPYAGVLALIVRRYARIFRWQAGNWKDVAAMGVIDALLAVLWLERFSF